MNDEKRQNNTKCSRKERIRYFIYFRTLSVGILLVFMIFMPYLADYYLRQPDITIFQYYEQHSVDSYYDFEAVLIDLFLFAMLFYTKGTGGAMFAAATPVMLLAYVSSIKYAARNELFRINDLKLTEAAGMAVHYLDFRFSRAQSIAIGTVLFLCICGCILDRYRIKYPLTIYRGIKHNSALIWLRMVLGSACLVIMVCYGHSFIKSTNSMWELDTYDVLGTCNDRYVLYNFLKNDKYATITVDNIDASYSYFNSKIQDLKINIDSGQRPTVIVIMNESWWNTDNIKDGNIFSSDPMSVYKELAQKCSVGQLSANIFGGGTISSETEFLTGLNTKYLISDTSVCSELAERKVSSIVDYFHALNYKTTAIHPYQGDFYNRDKIYAMMNFDQVIFEEDMDYTDIYTKFISDESLVKQIIKEYEEGTDTWQFIFAVSIANHLRNLEYTTDAVKEYDYPISVIIDRESFLDENYDDFVNYINGIALANEAFAQLVA